ncbi:hypothetical protein FRB94_010019 [Tulasnella sp. JGI-2019a]|nr:hypothetical protein FRB94_010019 [Tulasnella sp. JGI-2019a]
MSDLFGTRRDFWSKYDTFADKFDGDMMARLNTNLDVLLIFAGLFSAVNTAFIVVALTALTANPVEETNVLIRLLVLNAGNYTLTENDLSPPFTPGPAAVRQNCTFLASLCCSLLAAAGAVLGKQWLQSYERTGQTGPMEQQAIRRTEKFVGAENWGLRPVVETLATLLLISLALFFIALVDYLWTVNETVAIIVLAFAVLGGLLYILMIVLAAIFPTCPFQTGPSVALRRSCLMIQRLLYSPNIHSQWMDNIPFESHVEDIMDWITAHIGASNLVRIATSIVLLGLFIAFVILPLLIPTYIVFVLIIPFLRQRIPRHSELGEGNMSSLHARSAILMAESASNTDNIITVADNIPLISDIEAVRLIGTSNALQTLLSHLQKSVLDIRRGSQGIELANIATLSNAVAHVVLADPKRTANAVWKCLSDLDEQENAEGRYLQPMPIELDMLLRCVRTFYKLARIGYYNNEGTICRGESYPYELRSAALLRDRNLPPSAAMLRSGQFNSAAIIWLRHCSVTAAYNKWDGVVMGELVEELTDLFLFDGLQPDSAHLSRVIEALLAILRWYPLWGPRNGHPSLDDSTNLRSTWTVQESRSLIMHLVNTLNEFSRHYATEDPDTFPTFLRCQKRLLQYFHGLYTSSDVWLEVLPPSNPPLLSIREMHSSLNSSIERLLIMDSFTNLIGSFEEEVVSCRKEVVRTLHQLLLTSTTWGSINPIDLANSALLARRVGTISEKENLLQGIVYSIFTEVLRSQSDDELAVESRRLLLQKGPAVAVLLASTLRLLVWLRPSVPTDQSWAAFESFLRLLVIGDTPTIPSAPRNAPEAWDSVIEIPHDNYPSGSSCTALGVLWYTSRIRSGREALRQIDEGRLLDWFVLTMRKVLEDRWIETVPEELRNSWTIVEKKCAGLLFLDTWDATVDTDGDGLNNSQLSNWTSSKTLKAFVAWLSDYSGQEMVEIKLGDVVIMQVPIRPDLVARFVEHAALANSQADQEFGLRNLLKKIPRADRDPRGGVSNPALDTDRGKVAVDVVADAGREGCEWCIGGCMHCDPISKSAV